MTLSLFQSGTLTAAGSGVEDFLSSPNVAGTYQLYVDCVNMIAGDIVELKVYCMVLTGGTYRMAYYARYEGAQPTLDLIKISVPITTTLTDTNALRFSLTQSGAGSDKAFPWKVLQWAD